MNKITESVIEKFTVELLEKADSISSGFTRFMVWKTAGGKGDPAMDVKDEVAFFQAVKARLARQILDGNSTWIMGM
jgi:hypothetical protein